MAQKDYVSRGRTPKKAPPKPTPSIPWVRLVITVALVIGFGYFLWAISGNDDTEQAIQDGGPQPVVQKPAKEQDPLPEMPKDIYSYPEQLEDTTVEVEVGEQQKSERPYLMQCGSFRQQEQAETMRAKLAMQGLEAQVRASNGKNGRWYRVILGPYDYKRDAETDRHVIQRVGISTCQIWYWNL